MTLKTDNIQSVSGTQNVSQTTLFSGTAKAWSNLNGTGTIAERDSFNISGYVDNGEGDYTFTISSDMSDANYQLGGTATWDVTSPGTSGRHIGFVGSAPTAGAARVGSAYAANFLQDCVHVLPSIHGDLA